jgi:wyosine [tRNA(Phe)-imidazoG37] synthetase (radical SAM superfamily)
VPLKTCTQNCVYCQLGVDGVQTAERKEYIPIDDVLAEFRDWYAADGQADFITVSGSGEPTLNSGLGRLLKGVKELTDTTVSVLTNGTLLWEEDVRRDCSIADVVMPSLDAMNEEVFEKLNRPGGVVSFGQLMEGLVKFTGEYEGRIWLEFFVVEGMNTSDEQLSEMKELLRRVGPERVQLNTAVRPTADKTIIAAGPEVMARVKDVLSEVCEVEVIANYKSAGDVGRSVSQEDVLNWLGRRPGRVEDISDSMGASADKVGEILEALVKLRKIFVEVRDGEKYYLVR